MSGRLEANPRIAGAAASPLLGLLTGNIRLGAEIKLRHFKLWDVFQTGAFGDEHEDRGQIAALALERGSRIVGAALRGDEVLVIGDTPLDIRCARSIGARALAVATGGANLGELKKHRPDSGDTRFAGDDCQASGRLRQVSACVSRRIRNRRTTRCRRKKPGHSNGRWLQKRQTQRASWKA